MCIKFCGGIPFASQNGSEGKCSLLSGRSETRESESLQKAKHGQEILLDHSLASVYVFPFPPTLSSLRFYFSRIFSLARTNMKQTTYELTRCKISSFGDGGSISPSLLSTEICHQISLLHSKIDEICCTRLLKYVSKQLGYLKLALAHVRSTRYCSLAI